MQGLAWGQSAWRILAWLEIASRVLEATGPVSDMSTSNMPSLAPESLKQFYVDKNLGDRHQARFTIINGVACNCTEYEENKKILKKYASWRNVLRRVCDDKHWRILEEAWVAKMTETARAFHAGETSVRPTPQRDFPGFVETSFPEISNHAWQLWVQVASDINAEVRAKKRKRDDDAIILAEYRKRVRAAHVGDGPPPSPTELPLEDKDMMEELLEALIE